MSRPDGVTKLATVDSSVSRPNPTHCSARPQSTASTGQRDQSGMRQAPSPVSNIRTGKSRMSVEIARIDITVIRDYLRHASIATTSRYVTTNLKMKRDVLEAFWKRAGIAPARVTPWNPKPDLIAFLASL